MIKPVIIATIAASFVSPIAFSQVKFSRPKFQSPTPTPTPTPTLGKPMATPGRMPLKPTPTPTPAQWKPTSVPSRTQLKPTATPMPIQSRSTSRTQLSPIPTPVPMQAKPTPTPVPPPDVKAYLDRQVANSKDKKFHLTVNGKDLALTPFHVWAQKSTSVNSTSTCIDMRSDEGRVYDIDFVTTGAQVTNVKIHRINGELVR